MSEFSPDDPIVELPMKVVCMVCDTVIRESVAHWPQSEIKKMEKLKSWTGVAISRTYCSEHDPSRPET